MTIMISGDAEERERECVCVSEKVDKTKEGSIPMSLSSGVMLVEVPLCAVVHVASITSENMRKAKLVSHGLPFRAMLWFYFTFIFFSVQMHNRQTLNQKILDTHRVELKLKQNQI